MCTTCGCSEGAETTIEGAAHAHEHSHGESHGHGHHHPRPSGDVVTLEADILAWNAHLAEHNREAFDRRGQLAVNLLSSPGSGKTTLLSRTIGDLSPLQTCAVIEGDQATTNDAKRLREAGALAVQVNTGTGCHLEADMVAGAMDTLQAPAGATVFIENVGNLVCPALFDLGEHKRVVLLSVTEGEDKPEKYPHMFRSADLLLLTKVDLLPHLEFDLQRCLQLAREIRPDIEVIQVSSTNGEGLPEWYEWLQRQRAATASAA